MKSDRNRTKSTMETSDVDLELKAFRDDLYEKYGIFFPEKKFYQLEAKINKRMRALNLDEIREYNRYLENNPDEITPLLDEISTNHTKFYREPRHWEFLTNELIDQWADQSKIKAWSAACSSGEEPYTLALLLQHHLGGSTDNLIKSSPYRILATDLSQDVVREGMKGIYPRSALKPLRDEYPEIPSKFCERSEANYLKMDDRIRDNVVFRQFNLKSEQYPYRRKFDLVLIRNVLIYFDKAMKKHVIDNLTRSLNPGGYLFVGHSESLGDVDHDLTRVRPAIYQK